MPTSPEIMYHGFLTGPSLWSARGRVLGWPHDRFEAVRLSEQCALAASGFEPLVSSQLPGYGARAGQIAVTCLQMATCPVLVRDRTSHDLIGFIALRTTQIEGVKSGYILLTVFDPEVQAGGVFASALAWLATALELDVVAATTNVPGLVSGMWKVSDRIAASPWCYPHDALAPGPARAATAWARRCVGAAIDKPPAEIELDEQLVRRGLREHNLQLRATDDYLGELDQPGVSERMARIIERMRSMNMRDGDAVVAIAALSPRGSRLVARGFRENPRA